LFLTLRDFPLPAAMLAAAAAALLPLASADAVAATPTAALANMPPPGLYRINSDANVKHRDGATFQQKNDSTAGTASARLQKPGAAPISVSGAGTAQICIGATGAGLTPPADQGCKSSGPVHAANSTTFSSQCGFADTTVVVRKLDPKTWEMKTSIVERMGQMGMPDFAQQRKMLEISLKNAASAEERSDIQHTLDHWEDYKADMRQMVAETKGAGAPGADTRSSTIVTRLTRIGDTCKAAAAPAAKGVQ